MDSSNLVSSFNFLVKPDWFYTWGLGIIPSFTGTTLWFFIFVWVGDDGVIFFMRKKKHFPFKWLQVICDVIILAPFGLKSLILQADVALGKEKRKSAIWLKMTIIMTTRLNIKPDLACACLRLTEPIGSKIERFN